MRYKVNAYAKRTRKLTETEPTDNVTVAMSQGNALASSGKYKVVTILYDSEGADYTDNAGKFFLHRIIK